MSSVFGSFYTLNSPSGITLNLGNLVPFNSSSSHVNIISTPEGFKTISAGRYIITCGIEVIPSTTGVSQFFVRKGDVAVLGGKLVYTPNLGVLETPVIQSLAIIIDLTRDQLVNVQYIHNGVKSNTSFNLFSTGISNTISYFCFENLR